MSIRASKKKIRPDLSLENKVNGIVCGIDEVGRGPLAGPVTAAAVILPSPLPLILKNELNDSKKLSEKKRTELYTILKDCALIGIGEASVEEIDNINILQATFLAMKRASNALCTASNFTPDLALIDGNKSPDLNYPTRTVIKGDQKSLSIAAASIVAKHHRDSYMKKIALTHPEYHWHTNAGYGTKAHLNSLKIHGITPHHRKSFRPIHELIITSD